MQVTRTEITCAFYYQLPADLNTLAIQLRNLGRLAEAEPLLRRALARDEKLRGALHPRIPHRLNNLCMVLIMQGKLDEAKPLLARAWRIKSGATLSRNGLRVPGAKLGREGDLPPA